MDRRRLLTLGGVTLGGVVGGTLFLPTRQEPAASAPSPTDHAGHHNTAGARASLKKQVVPFSSKMPVPRVLAPVRRTPAFDEYQMDIQPAQLEILPGLLTSVRTYAGDFIGPTIRARTGRPVRVTFTNKLDVPSNVHLHGGHTPMSSDGYPTDIIPSGQSRVYDYPNIQQGTTLWYHDHAHVYESENVYYGLHGFYILDDDAERGLNLPSGEFDVPIMLRDGQFDEKGNLVYPSMPTDRTTILANGKVTPCFPVAARKYRFRLLNSAIERVFRLTLGGAEIIQIGTDGGLLPAPVSRKEIVFGSGERVDIIVDFAKVPVGTKLVLQDVSGPVLRFDVVRMATDNSRIPATLRELPALPPATVERDVVFKFQFEGDNLLCLLNGKPFDPNRVDFKVTRGSTEIWKIYNADTDFGSPHTFHMHLEQFRVLDRNGGPPNQDDLGRKDTVFVGPGETVRVQAHFTDFLGKYTYHCHFNDHSSCGMMAQMEIVD